MSNHVTGGMMAAVKDGTEPGLQFDPRPGHAPQSFEPAWAVILAAGSGSRMGSQVKCPKQFISFSGKPLYWHSVHVFARCACVSGLVLVFPADYCETEKARMTELCSFQDPGMPWRVVAGGKCRAESSWLGLQAVPEHIRKVMIHDAARPFISAGLVWRIFNALGPETAGVIPALPVKDTIKQLDACGRVLGTLPRDELAAVQTPQLFDAACLRKAFSGSSTDFKGITDDASLLEKMGGAIFTVPGEEQNIKITTAEDLLILKEREMRHSVPCTGFGYDAHRYGPGHPLILGGKVIPCALEIIAHSDGDVLLHALGDALLGLAGLGDMGSHFPDSDPRYSGISSAFFIDRITEMLSGHEIELCHVDLTVVAQKPRLEPWKKEIVKNIARLLNLNQDQINLKATTEEGMGFTGSMEGIKAYAVATGLRHRGDGRKE